MDIRPAATNPASLVTTISARLPGSSRDRTDKLAESALRASVAFWFAVTLTGQWVFVYYIVAFFGGSALRGDWESWNKALPHGIIPGDSIGNLAVALHVLLAAVITFCGPLQLLPRLRDRAPAFHRWSGRLYMLTAFAISLDGLYMVFTRGAVGGLTGNIAISLNAVLILVFAANSLRHALRRDLVSHRRWALRLFLAVSGVWFFRIGLMFWILVNRGPVGFDPETFEGSFLTIWSFGQYLLPLAVLEMYFRVRERAGSPGRVAMSAGLVVLTVAMAAGIVGAVLGMWLPRL